MRRIGLAVVLAFSLFALHAADAEQAAKAPRIGILAPQDILTSDDDFRRGLRDLGYAEESGTRIEYRSSGGSDDRFPALAADLVALKVDVIVAVTPPAIRAAQRVTTSIPIVMVLSGDPVLSGLVKSLARPGANTTGPATLTYDLMPKRLEILTQAVSNLRDIAVIANPLYPGVPEKLHETEVAGHQLGIKVHTFEVRDPKELKTAFAAIVRAKPGGMLVEPSPLTGTFLPSIIEFARANRLPDMYALRDAVQGGGFISYGIDYAAHVRAAIGYVDKILKGAKPADLPVEQPTKFELVINLKTAKALGLTIPQTLLLRTNQVIE
jgi:putative ABC transport system substrate-binding protein